MVQTLRKIYTVIDLSIVHICQLSIVLAFTLQVARAEFKFDTFLCRVQDYGQSFNQFASLHIHKTSFFSNGVYRWGWKGFLYTPLILDENI